MSSIKLLVIEYFLLEVVNMRFFKPWSTSTTFFKRGGQLEFYFLRGGQLGFSKFGRGQAGISVSIASDGQADVRVRPSSRWEIVNPGQFLNLGQDPLSE